MSTLGSFWQAILGSCGTVEGNLMPRAQLLKPGAQVLKPGAQVLKPRAQVLEPGAQVLKPGAQVLKPLREIGESKTRCGRLWAAM